MTCYINIIKIMNEAKLTSNDLCSTALAALMFVCHQALQMWQETVQVCISMIPEKTLPTQPNWKNVASKWYRLDIGFQILTL
jgi:hypothetical protein